MILHYCIFLLFILFNFVISERESSKTRCFHQWIMGFEQYYSSVPGNYTYIYTKQEPDLGPALIKWFGIGLVAFMILYFLFRDDKNNAPEVERDDSNNNNQGNTYVGSKFRRHLRTCKGFFWKEKKQGSKEHEVIESEQNVQPSISTKDNIDADDNRRTEVKSKETAIDMPDGK